MKELFERMELEGMNVVVAKNWFEEFNACLNKCEALYNNGQVYITTDEYKKSQELYENLYGFIWGLEIVRYITTELSSKYVDELIDSYNF